MLYRVGCPDTGLWLDECDQTNPDYDSCGLFIVRDSRARPLSTFHYDSELSRETMLASDRIARMLMYPAPIDLMPLSREPRADYGAGLPRPAWWGTLPDDDVRLYLGRIAGVLPAGN